MTHAATDKRPRKRVATKSDIEGPRQMELPLAAHLVEQPEPTTIEPSTPTPPVNLAEMLERLMGTDGRDRRHQEMKSAVRRMGDVLRLPLHRIPTDPPALRALIKDATPRGGGTPRCKGLSKERWSRVRSLVLAGLRDLGVDLEPGREQGGRSPAWEELAAATTSTQMRLATSRFMSYCTRRGIEPSYVAVATFREFEEALHQRSLKANPGCIFRTMVRNWNKAVDEVPGWPDVRAPLLRHARFYSREWADFPASYVADVEAFLADKNDEDVFSEDYIANVRNSTTASRRRHLRQLSTNLLDSGFPMDDLTSLAVLAAPQNVKAALKQQLIRTNNAIGSSLEQQAWLLAVVALHWVKAPADREQIAKIAKNLEKKRKTKQQGMTSRNKSRLRQFDNPENVNLLIDLPRRVFLEAAQDRLGTIAEARRVTLALAVEMLIVAPLRVANVCGLEIDRHLVATGRGSRQTHHILIPADEMKTGKEYEVKVPEDTALLLEVFLATYHPRSCPQGSLYLFGNPAGEKRNTTSFSKLISNFIKRETGLVMHAHLFRHFAGKLHLDRRPEDIETVRRLLGHATTETTLRYYVEHRTSQAYETYGETVAALRAAAAGKGLRALAREIRA